MVLNILTKICFGLLYGLAGIIFYCYSSDSDYEFGDDASYTILMMISMGMGFALLISVLIHWNWVNFLALLFFAAFLAKLSFDSLWLFDFEVEEFEEVEEIEQTY